MVSFKHVQSEKKNHRQYALLYSAASVNIQRIEFYLNNTDPYLYYKLIFSSTAVLRLYSTLGHIHDGNQWFI
jgi:hypothetical protein